MLLTRIAKIYHRWRQAFFRLPRFQRYAGLTVVAGLAIVAAYTSVGTAYARRFPWLSPQVDTYARWQPGSYVQTHPEVFSWALAQLTNKHANAIQSAVSWMAVMPDGQHEFVANEDSVAFIFKNQAQIPTVFPEEWKNSRVQIGDDTYLVLYLGDFPKHTRIVWNWLPALRLDALAQAYDGVFLTNVRQGLGAMPVFGVLDVAPERWTALFSPSSRTLRYPRIKTIEYPAALAGLRANREMTSVLHAFLPADRIQELPPLWLSISGFPFEFYVNGAVSLALDTFSDTISWKAVAQADLSQANSMLRGVLAELKDRFPLAVERVLPDNSKVFELKRSESFFLSSGQDISVNATEPGVFTFPHDQIAYRYDEGRLTLQKGDAWQNSEQGPSGCSLDQAIASGFVDGSVFGTNLWKTLFLSVDTSKIAVCVDWNPADVDNS